MRKSVIVASVFVSSAAVGVACDLASSDELAVAKSDPLERPDGPAEEASVTSLSPCANRNPLKNPYFGDLHTHTSYSTDAYNIDTRNTPLDAYAFARGKTLQIAGASPDGGGPLTTIDRPLDFLAVTDHSEGLVVTYGCGDEANGKPLDPASPIYNTPQCAAFREASSRSEGYLPVAAVLAMCAINTARCAPIATSAWQKEQQAAAAAYDRCNFTSFVAYEWSASSIGAMWHKNVIFASDKVPVEPFDSLRYPKQEQLWQALSGACTQSTGCDALTIPHNSNLSRGLTFEVPPDPNDRARMARYQRLAEIFQHKGSSECLSDSDPDCNFELLPLTKNPERDKPGYVREGLKKGLALQATTGQNPLALGIVGSTDTHNATPGNVKESTWPGHGGNEDDTPEKRIGQPFPLGASSFNPGGLAVVWAEENTRESIFAALKRRETYATSGPRMVVRFYQTFAPGPLCAEPSFPQELLVRGAVPMGGTFTETASAPRFVVRAWKDAADLARVDIVKAWVDGQGAVQEKVVQSPLAGTARASACVIWQDDEPASGPAFYYARVLEAPTPRWSAYDCDRTDTKPLACAPVTGLLRSMIEERAWTSPIWRLAQ